MMKVVRQVMERLKSTGDHVIVGDAAGIDALVIFYANQLGIPCAVYGATERPRSNVYHFPYHYIPHQGSMAQAFLNRDRVMVSKAGMCIAIWNGASRGTQYTFNQAIQRGLEVHVWNRRWKSYPKTP